MIASSAATKGADVLATIVAALACGRTGCPCARGRNTHCPAHDDAIPSLSLRENQGEILWHCQAGCSQSAVQAALRQRGLLPAGGTNGHQGGDHTTFKGEPVVARYRYEDEKGQPLFYVGRTPSKQFPVWQAGAGTHDWGLNGARRVLYRLPRVIEAVAAGRQVFIVEGEKDVEAVEQTGGVATCNPGGAGKWRDEYSQALCGANIVIVADKDEPGREHAVQVAASMAGRAASVRVVEAVEGKDAADHLAAPYGLDDFRDVEVASLVPRSSALSPDRRSLNGASFLLDAPSEVRAIWGRDNQVLWSHDESLMIAGPQGAGKTTIAQQLALARMGLRSEVLGFPVEPGTRKVLYIAADRPAQAQRSMRRMVTEADREVLAERLMVWKGPLPFDLGKEPDLFVEFIIQHQADTVIIDSLKDVAVDLVKDEVGARVNHAFQLVVAAGIQVAINHHQRKATALNNKPKSLSDVYGSVWLTAGCGSVLLLWGDPGDPIVELVHLKPPVEEVGPLKVLHNHDAGESSLFDNVDPLAVLRAARNGLTAEAAARALYQKSEPTRNEIEKARRRLQHLVKRGLAHEREGERGGQDGGTPARWYAVDRSRGDHGDHGRRLGNPFPGSVRDHESDHAGVWMGPFTERSRRSHDGGTQNCEGDHEPDHGAHAESDHERVPLFKEGTRDRQQEKSESCIQCGGELFTYGEDGAPLCEDHAPERAP